jgi:hypothetical protein
MYNLLSEYKRILSEVEEDDLSSFGDDFENDSSEENPAEKLGGFLADKLHLSDDVITKEINAFLGSEHMEIVPSSGLIDRDGDI